MKFLLISPKNRTVHNFRGDLIKEIQKKGYEVIVTGPDNIDMDKIQALGVKFVEIPIEKTGTNFIRDLKYCRTLYKLIKKESIDISLGYTVKPVIFGSIAAKFAGVKNINSMVTGAGFVFASHSLKARVLKTIVKMLYKIAFSFSNNIIFQNNDDKIEFCEMGLAKDSNCHVVNGSGINMQRFAPSPYPKDTTFFMLSRLLKSKGVLEYLEAAKNVKKRYLAAKFMLLGAYDNNADALAPADIEPYIKDGIVERYEETGDVRPFYEKASVYVLPSYREGVPRTNLEAMAMARPVITTDTNGCRETVKDGYNGFLVPVGDAFALEEKMVYFLENATDIDSMGESSYAYCKDKFEVGIVNGDMMRIMGVL